MQERANRKVVDVLADRLKQDLTVIIGRTQLTARQVRQGDDEQGLRSLEIVEASAWEACETVDELRQLTVDAVHEANSARPRSHRRSRDGRRPPGV
jgi:hypothetical protein